MSERKVLKLGSLFDGSGGFPLAAQMCGIIPTFASEVEPYPIAVTTSRFPNMKHLGDVSKINGAEIEPVDIITFGSPCQDMSVAGKREGIKHESNGDETTTRSGLFVEAIRIIREMRTATGGKYPRYAIWENVLGAFSSNKGEDFRLVIEEFVKVSEPEATGPQIPKGGWPHADCYVGDGWSIAYRTVDAQYWGVPQRRRRIYLVADFAGERAGEILFKQEGLRGNFEKSRTQWEGTATNVEDCARISDCKNEHLVGSFLAQKKAESMAWCTEEISPCLHNGACPGFQNAIVMEQDDLSDVVDKNILDDQGGQQITVRTDGKCPTLRAETHGNLPCILSASGFKAGQSMAGGIGWQEECAATLSAQASGTEPTVCVKYKLHDDPADEASYSMQGFGDYKESDCVATLGASHDSDMQNLHVYGMDMKQYNALKDKTPPLTATDYKDPMSVCYGVDCRNFTENEELYPTLQAKSNGGQSLNYSGAVRCEYVDTTHADDVVRIDSVVAPLQARDFKGGKLIRNRYVVRRLTPTECCRLQGFPDGWGVPIVLTDMNEKERKLWQDIRNTHALINGKEEKTYTKEQILKWRNGLHTDSAEYKMWGNGICLYNALYVMQGIVNMS